MASLQCQKQCQSAVRVSSNHRDRAMVPITRTSFRVTLQRVERTPPTSTLLKGDRDRKGSLCRAGKMSQSVKGFSCKHEGPSLIPRTHGEKPDGVVCIVAPERMTSDPKLWGCSLGSDLSFRCHSSTMEVAFESFSWHRFLINFLQLSLALELGFSHLSQTLWCGRK